MKRNPLAEVASSSPVRSWGIPAMPAEVEYPGSDGVCPILSERCRRASMAVYV